MPYTPRRASPVPAWLKPENERPDDPYWLQVARRAARLIGADDPVGTGMGLGMAAIDVPGVKAPLTKLTDVVKRGARTLTGGFYSRVDDLLTTIGKGGVSPARLSKLVSADTALAEEAAHRKVPDLIAQGGGPRVTQKTIPLSAVQTHLAAHPAPVPVVKTLGTPQAAVGPFPIIEAATVPRIQLPGGGYVHIGKTRQGWIVGGVTGRFPTYEEAVAAGQRQASEIVRSRTPEGLRLKPSLSSTPCPAARPTARRC